MRRVNCPDYCGIFGKQLKNRGTHGEIDGVFVQVAVEKTGKIWQKMPIKSKYPEKIV